MDTRKSENELRQPEGERCLAMMAGEKERLQELLHRDLVHVHAKGQVDTYESYFSEGGFRVDYTRVERSELEVHVLGDTALMTGRQLLEAVRNSNGERVRINSRVMQVWSAKRAAGSSFRSRRRLPNTRSRCEMKEPGDADQTL